MFKRIFTILLSAILAAGSLVALATPATASVGPMTIRYVTTAANQTVCLPIGGTNTGVKVDWKDNSALDSTILSSGTSAHMTHAFATAGTYDVEIAEGTITRFGSEFCATGTKGKMVAVLSWGNQIDNITSLERAFNEEVEFIDVPNVMPPKVTSLAYTFARAYKFNHPNVSSWDTSGVTNMTGTFMSALVFNQPIETWNTSSVTNMGSMFSNGFSSTTKNAFNKPLAGWDTSQVTNMASMFQSSEFNQPINMWNVSKVENMSNMFQYNTSFNQSLENWDTTSLKDTSFMFFGASAFNGKLTDWKTNRITNMRAMFQEARNFNQPLLHVVGTNVWNTSTVANMFSMFENANKFNQDISSWDTSSVTNMAQMFYGSAFNQPIGSWNVAKVENMYLMFYNVDSFDQSLAAWNITKVGPPSSGTGSAIFMLNSSAGKGMSPANYSATLRGWAARLDAYKLAGNTPAAVSLGAGSRQYFCDDATWLARKKLVDAGWIITGDSTSCTGAQTVTWSPTNTSVDEGLGNIVPNKKAYSSGHGEISYQVVASTGTMTCQVSNTPEITFTGAGSCVVRATAAAVKSSGLNGAPGYDLGSGFTQVTFTAKPSQTVTWNPTNLTALSTAGTITPNSLAASDGDGSIAYLVQSAGTTGCTVNSTTGVISFTAAGTCTIRATAQSTANSGAGFKDLSFVISAPPAPSGGGSGTVIETKLSPKVTEVSKPRIIGKRPTAVELLGEELRKVTGVKIGSKTIAVSGVEDQKLNFILPTLASGTYQIELVHEDSSVATAQTITVVAPSIVVSNFTGDSAKLTAQKSKAIRNAVALYATAGSLTCVGSTSGSRVTKFDTNLARQRALSACNLAKRINPELQTSIKVTPAIGLSAKNRKVELLFSK